MIPITESNKQVQKNPPIRQPQSQPNLIPNTKEVATNVIQTSTVEELTQYYHQCLLSPPKATLLRAINNQPLTTSPGLTYDLISKHLSPSTATDKGHMKRRRQNIRSIRSNKDGVKQAKYEAANIVHFGLKL